MTIIHSLKCTVSFSFVVPLVVTRCHPLPFAVTRCHSLSLVVPLVVIRYHSLPFVVTRCHSLSLDVPLVCLFINNPIKKRYKKIRKNIFACLFSVHNTISLSRHEQVCLMRPHKHRRHLRNYINTEGIYVFNEAT